MDIRSLKRVFQSGAVKMRTISFVNDPGSSRGIRKSKHISLSDTVKTCLCHLFITDMVWGHYVLISPGNIFYIFAEHVRLKCKFDIHTSHKCIYILSLLKLLVSHTSHVLHLSHGPIQRFKIIANQKENKIITNYTYHTHHTYYTLHMAKVK